MTRSARLRRLSTPARRRAGWSFAAIVTWVGLRRLAPRVPAALVVVVGAIIVSQAADLSAHGVAVLGDVPRGLPHLSVPAFGLHDVARLMGVSASMFVVILAQSSATSRAYAARHGEPFDENVDLVALGAANVAAAFTGAFVVNGSPTKTQLVDSAGGRSQLAQLTTSAIVLLVLLLLTGTLAPLPIPVLATVVFLIAIELIDVRGIRRILAVRPVEFAVALITAGAVVALGVEQGVVIAVVASMVDHLRHSYDPRSSVLAKSAAGHWQSLPLTAGRRTEPGLVIYRFGSSLYFANTAAFLDDVTALTATGDPPSWFCLDGAAIGDVDYTAAAVLFRAHRAAPVTRHPARRVQPHPAGPPPTGPLRRHGRSRARRLFRDGG